MNFKQKNLIRIIIVIFLHSQYLGGIQMFKICPKEIFIMLICGKMLCNLRN